MKVKCKGIIRDKQNMLKLKKEALRAKHTRFVKKNIPQSYEMNVIAPELLNKPLMQPATQRTLSAIPQWKQHYDHCCQTQVMIIGTPEKSMMIYHAKRLASVKEIEQREIQNKIYDLATEATRKIKICEKILKKIKQESEINSEADQKTCQNICCKLAVEIQMKTKQIRSQQRAFIQQRKQIQESSKASFLQLAAQKMLEEEYEGQEQIISMGFQTQSRNEQINRIVESVEELNSIYKQLNNMVIMQGTLLDRIDCNIDESYVQVQEGNKHIQSARKKQQSKFACRFMLLLLVGIFILGIILVVKWSN